MFQPISLRGSQEFLAVVRQIEFEGICKIPAPLPEVPAIENIVPGVFTPLLATHLNPNRVAGRIVGKPKLSINGVR
jgi:hypothetical protein